MKFKSPFICLILVFFFVLGAQAENIIMVDKSTFQLHIMDAGKNFEIIKSFPITIGKMSGDKLIEGDLKTPEGIYQFIAKYTPPQIKPKLGAMGFYIDYPNYMDKREGKTGFDILLHSTNDPARLEKSQDSDGCIVVDDERIKAIDPYIEPRKTSILIFDELKPEYIQDAYYQELKNIFEKWLEAWNSKDIETYIDLYSDKFTSKGMNKAQYKEYKQLLNKKYHKISVTTSDIKLYRHPKYSLVTYRQSYVATFKDGRVAFNVQSPKTLYLVPENGALKIISEGN